MAKFEHEQLLKTLAEVSTRPTDKDELDKWITIVPQLKVLIDNINDNEYIASALSEYLYVETAIVPREQIANPDIDDLLRWSIMSTDYRVYHNYVDFKNNKNICLEEVNILDCQSIANSQLLVFYRKFEGINDSSRDYYELLQEFTHSSDIHWRDEHKAYCKFDKNGDLDKIVSISNNPIKLVTVNRDILDEYLYATDSVIVRVFDFTLCGPSFNGWDHGEEEMVNIGNTYFRQYIEPSHGSYTRGFQIITPRNSDEDIYARISPFSRDKKRKYVEFIARDWRHGIVREISTDPNATTNYFDAKEGLPFELSPAFFRPEVLLKYKNDHDKYTFSSRRIKCRTAWSLKGFDVNEAGQVHAYICDLRSLPYEEQLYWRSFNEAPKADISKRAIANDFQGNWISETDPLNKIKYKLQSWQNTSVSWWSPTDDRVFEKSTAPVTDNRDEWAGAFMELSQLVIEGFKIKQIRKALDGAGILYEQAHKSIKLLELLCETTTPELSGLKEVQAIRQFKGHSGALKFEASSNKAIKEHGSYPKHFGAVCEKVLEELDIIENTFEAILKK